MGILKDTINSAAAIAKGMGVTFKAMLSPKTTVQYPDDKPPVKQRFRGRHVLQRHENGLERCIGCALCAAACPAQAIYVEAAEDGSELSPNETYILMPCADQTLKPVRMRASRRLTLSEYRMGHLSAVKLSGKLSMASELMQRIGEQILGQEVIEEAEARLRDCD